jgi:hypothetical protein
MNAILRVLVGVTVAVSLGSCGGPTGYMKPTASLATPDATSAVVRFLRPSRFVGSARDYALLDGDHAIGALSNGAQFGYVTTPGKHLFIAPGFGTVGPYFLEAELAPGKIYYVLVSSYQEDASTRRVLLTPLTSGADQWKEVPTYEKDLTRLEPDRATLEAWSVQHRDEIKRLILNYNDQWKREHPGAKIAPEDGV